MPHTILIVEDDLTALRALAAILAREGYDTIQASAFEDAKRLLDDLLPDLLIVDVRLGAFNGLQLLLRHRFRRPDGAALVMTGFPDAVLETEARRQGAAFLLKPVEPAELLRRIAELLQRVRPADAGAGV